MSGPEEMHIRFQHLGTDYNIDLVKGKKADHSVEINGIAYAVLGDQEKLETACKILASVSLDAVTSEKDLLGRLSLREDISFPQAQKTDTIGTAILKKPIEGLDLASDLAETVQEHMLKPTTLEQATFEAQDRLQETCPKGAGAIVMVSNLEEGAKIISGGSRTVEGGAIDGQTAAIIGSGTKMFTSLCSMALISQGVINKKTNKPLTLDTKVSDVFSKRQMAIFEDQEKASELTLGMLLSHTSGLVYFADDNRDDRSGQGLGEILIKKAPGSVKFFGYPGDQIYSYSNHIGLAAAMIEIACEKPYSEVLKETVLDPLGMTRTSYLCPNDENVLLAFAPPLPGTEETQPKSQKLEVTDPMMQGAGGLWSCMDDMAKLGVALGKALSKKKDLTNDRGHVIISRENLEKMMTPQAINAPCGLAFDLENDVIGKGGGVFGYDFKFKVDSKTGNCISMMCNHAGQGKFDRYLAMSTEVLTTLNPKVSLPSSSKPKPKSIVIEDLTIAECPRQFKGFSGILAFPDEHPLTRVNFNGTTLPVKQLSVKGTNLFDRYVVIGDSPFQGKELQLFQKNEHLYPCFSEGMEVWSFGEINNENFPVISAEAIHKQFNQAAGDYIDTTPGGPPPHTIRVDSKNGISLSFPDMAPSKCLITSFSDTEINFRTCIGGGPQPFSFKLIKSIGEEDWRLLVLNGETGEPAGNPLLRRK